MKKHYLLLFFIFTVQFSFAQNGEIEGTTITNIPGITRSFSEVIAQEKAHPLPPNFVAPLRPELEGPKPIEQNPLSNSVQKEGSLVGGIDATTSSVSSSASVSSYSNFLAIWGSYATVSGRESPFTPPDNCGDVGFTQVIATANCRMKIFTKPSVTGTPSTTPTGSSTTTLTNVLNVDLNIFFANASLGISDISDPHVRFDRLSGRWFIVAIDVNHKTNNYCCVAVSNQGTLTASSNFKIYYFNVSQTGGSSQDFFDYPTLGIDKNYLYIGGNMFKTQRTFSGCSMWVVNKASIINGSLTVTGFRQSVTNTNMYTPQGVHNDDAAATQGYFIGASQTAFSELVIKRVNYGTTPTLSADLPLTTITTYTPKTVPTLSGTSIDGNDRRLCAAMVMKNKITGKSSLWIAQGTRISKSGIGSSTGDRDGAYWAEIGNLTSTPTILQSAMLYDGANTTSSALYFTYPTIAASGQGDNLMGFTSAGPAKYCQASSASRFRTDAVATFNLPQDFTTSTSSYNPGASRWGDFTQTVIDPADNMTMWTFTEYTATTNSWGVRAAQFKAPPPSKPVLASIPTSCGTSTKVTINGTSTNHSEFFDPGTGYTKRLTVSVSGPAAVSVASVAFINPTQVTAFLTFTTSGTYTLKITNPDGQSATSSAFTVNCPAIAISAQAVSSISGAGDVTKTIIYPNPAHDILNLVNANSSNSIIQVLDYKGQILQQIRASGINSRLNVSNLPAGIYMIKIISGNKVEVQKFVKD